MDWGTLAPREGVGEGGPQSGCRSGGVRMSDVGRLCLWIPSSASMCGTGCDKSDATATSTRHPANLQLFFWHTARCRVDCHYSTDKTHVLPEAPAVTTAAATKLPPRRRVRNDK